MKRAVLSILAFLAVSAGWWAPVPASAAQQYYLATSPDGHTRVVVSQRLLRRVEDRLFFEYPVSLVDVKSGSRFELFTAGSPLVTETERGTFTCDHDALRVEWAPGDGSLMVVFWERESGVWSVQLVDRSAKTKLDLLPILKEGLLKKAASSGLECEDPVVSVFKWLTPLKPVFTLQTNCGKSLKENRDMHKMTPFTHWVMYDAEKAAVKECAGCSEEKALQLFNKKPKPTPSPTPVDDSTPTAQ